MADRRKETSAAAPDARRRRGGATRRKKGRGTASGRGSDPSATTDRSREGDRGPGPGRRGEPRPPPGRAREPVRSGPPGTAGAFQVRLARGPVPLGRQIAAQVAGSIRSGRYPAGRRLPSVRALSARLDVHRNTVSAAYRQLEEQGLVTLRPGSGAYVTPGPTGAAFTGTENGALRAFLARERAAGRTAAEVAGLLEGWRRTVAARRILVVGDDEPLRRIWAEELRRRLAPEAVRVESCAPAELRNGQAGGEFAVAAAPPARLWEAASLLPPWTELFPLRPGPCPRARRLLLQLPPGAVLAVVSRSGALRRQVRDMAAGLRGGEVMAVGAAPDSPRTRRVLAVARFVLADVTCRTDLLGQVPDGRLLTLRHLRPEAADALARYLGPPPPGAGRGSEAAASDGPGSDRP